MRWVVASLLILLVGAALIGLAHPRTVPGDAARIDELLAYEMGSERPIVLALPGGISRVSVTTWGLAKPSDHYDPKITFTYAFDATLETEDDRPVATRRYYQVSRISADPRGPLEADRFAARVADDAQWAEDPRTTEVDLRDLHLRPGRLRLATAAGDNDHMMVRVTLSEPRSHIEQSVLTASLDAEKRRAIVGTRASLGFFDLPIAARFQALATWNRRVPALGRRGVDYIERRLLIGALRGSEAVVPREPRSVDIGPDRFAVLNVNRALALRVRSDRATTLRIVEPSGNARGVPLEKDRAVEVLLSGDTLRSVELSARDAVRVFLDAKGRDAAAQVGDLPREPREDDRVEIGPDIRKERFFELDPGRPVSLRVATGEDTLAVVLRAALETGAHEMPARLWAQWKSHGRVGRADLAARLVRSPYDVFAARGDATDPAMFTIRLPDGVDRVDVFGDAKVCALFATREPGVDENVANPAYPEPDAEEVWKNAPYDLKEWANVLPDNDGDLALAGRSPLLLAQVRLDQRGKRGAGARPERSIEPEGTPPRRELFTGAWLAKGALLPEGVWTRVDDKNAVKVAAQGSAAGRLQLLYRIPPDALGQTLRVLLDGEESARQPLVLASGTLERSAPPGLHRVSVLGLGERGEAFVRAAPAEGGAVVKRQSVFELRKGGSLEFDVDQHAGESLGLVVFVVTEGNEAPWHLSYSIDGGAVRQVTGRFFKRTTTPKGALEGRSDLTHGSLWEAKREPGGATNADGIGRGEIRLGDDLGGGRHVVRLRLSDPEIVPGAKTEASLSTAEANPERVFIRAVVVGQPPPEEDAEPRLWTAEPW